MRKTVYISVCTCFSEILGERSSDEEESSGDESDDEESEGELHHSLPL